MRSISCFSKAFSLMLCIHLNPRERQYSSFSESLAGHRGAARRPLWFKWAAEGLAGFPVVFQGPPEPSLWRPPGTPLLFNWCWCVHPMKAGAALYKDTAPRATGRSAGRDREVWMQFEPCCPDGVLNVRRRTHGEKCAAGCPRAGGTIPPSRPATPRTLTGLFVRSDQHVDCHKLLEVTPRFLHAFTLEVMECDLTGGAAGYI